MSKEKKKGNAVHIVWINMLIPLGLFILSVITVPLSIVAACLLFPVGAKLDAQYAQPLPPDTLGHPAPGGLTIILPVLGLFGILFIGFILLVAAAVSFIVIAIISTSAEITVKEQKKIEKEKREQIKKDGDGQVTTNNKSSGIGLFFRVLVHVTNDFGFILINLYQLIIAIICMFGIEKLILKALGLMAELTDTSSPDILFRCLIIDFFVVLFLGGLITPLATLISYIIRIPMLVTFKFVFKDVRVKLVARFYNALSMLFMNLMLPVFFYWLYHDALWKALFYDLLDYYPENAETFCTRIAICSAIGLAVNLINILVNIIIGKFDLKRIK